MLVVVFLAACASSRERAPGGETDAITDPSASAPSSLTSVSSPGSSVPADVPEILDFEAPLLGGDSLRGASLAGRPLAIWFWAPW